MKPRTAASRKAAERPVVIAGLGGVLREDAKNGEAREELHF
jgi:hypothetical protein